VQRRLGRVREQVIALVLGGVRDRIGRRLGELDQICAEVLAGRLDAFAAAEQLSAGLPMESD